MQCHIWRGLFVVVLVGGFTALLIVALLPRGAAPAPSPGMPGPVDRGGTWVANPLEALRQPSDVLASVLDEMRGVVQVVRVTPRGLRPAGTGIVWRDGRHIVTAGHVVVGAGGADLQVTLPDGRSIPVETVAHDWPFTDVAVLRLRGDPLEGALPLGSSATVTVRAPVVGVGWDRSGWRVRAGLRLTTTPTHPPDEIGSAPDDLIGVTSVSAPGQSGGPLLDQYGNVVGLILGGSFAYTAAVKVENFSLVADTIISCLCRYPRPDFGALDVVTITQANASEFGAALWQGALVRDVQASSAFGEAGVIAGDIVLAIDGVEITPERWYYSVLKEFQPGQTVDVRYWHAGEIRTTRVTAGCACGNRITPTPVLTNPPTRPRRPKSAPRQTGAAARTP